MAIEVWRIEASELSSFEISDVNLDRSQPNEMYALQRSISACAGRGRYPIKFNGSISTVPPLDRPGDADYRRWGPGYWWQNTRLPYLSMYAASDFEMMEPIMRMYVDDLLSLARYRTRHYFDHGDAYYSECVHFWGDVFNEAYGWTPFEEREDKLQTSGWHKWEWVSGLEFVYMLLDYYDYTLDESVLHHRLLPAAHEVLTFFNEHYPTDSTGELVMQPAQALETWWDCTNPMPEIAGLHALTTRLLALPEQLTTPEQRKFWKALQKKLPSLPTRIYSLECSAKTSPWLQPSGLPTSKTLKTRSSMRCSRFDSFRSRRKTRPGALPPCSTRRIEATLAGAQTISSWRTSVWPTRQRSP